MAWLLVYPDTYEIGLPNQGLQILYEILNERADAVAERSYAPWLDLEALMRARRTAALLGRHPPAGRRLRPHRLQPVGRARLHERPQLPRPRRRARPRRATAIRRIRSIGAGGHCAFNPEPLADFVDFFVLGEGEEVVCEITEVVRRVEGQWAHARSPRARAARARPRRRRLRAVDVRGRPTTARASSPSTPRYGDVPEQVDKRTVADLAEWPYPKRQLVPLTEVVHDRLNVEVFRGCTRGCRFCQAGMITRPVRERPADQVRTMVRDGLRRTGYDEVSLTSLSTADFSRHRAGRRRRR